MRALVLVLVALLAAACAGPTVTANQYRGEVAQTGKAMTGIIVTAQHAARLDLDGKMLPTVTDSIVGDAERDADSVQTTMMSRQPPDDQSDQLRQQVEQPLQQATSFLTDLRIAVRNDDHDGQRAAAGALDGPLKAFRQLSEASG